MNKHRFLREVERQLESIYHCRKSGLESSAKVKHRCEGFMRAGEFMELVTMDELSELIEQTHLKILDETVKERELRLKKQNQWSPDEIDYSEFDTPTYERGKIRT